MRTLFALTHVVSQLLYKWLSPPRIDEEPSYCENLSKISLKEWGEIVSHELNKEKSPFAWAGLYKKAFDSSGLHLASSTYHHINQITDAGGQYVLFCDSNYPPLLKAIADPPLGLSVLGNINNLESENNVSIIGSRKASYHSINEAFKLGYELSLRKITVISGGALGCDIAAHRGVLANTTGQALAIVVLAGGLKNPYPTRNRFIFNELLKKEACLISERLWWEAPRPYDFPVRNRLISGLAREVIIIQANIESGAMITARRALDQGREVHVLIHPKDDIRAEGNWVLLEDGALGFFSAEEYLDQIFHKYIMEPNLVRCIK